MCFPIHQLDPRTQRIKAIANGSLLLGLVPWVFRQQLPVNHGWLQAFCGLFICISIAANLFASRRTRCRGEDGNAQ